MLASFQNEILVAARLLFGSAFVFAGLRNVVNAAFLTQLMTARGVPQAELALGSALPCRSSPAASLWRASGPHLLPQA